MTLQLRPCKRNLLVKFTQPKNTLILSSADSTLSPTFDDSQRTRVKILAVSRELEAEFEPGQFLLLRPNPNFLPVSDTGEVLIDASVVEAIVINDTVI